MTDPLTPVLLALEADLDTKGWDQPPTVFWVMRRQFPGPLTMHVLPLDTSLWTRAPRAYTNLATLASLGKPPIAAHVQAVGYSDEVWQVWAPLSNPYATEQNRRDTLARRLHERPDRDEMRAVYAVDREGRHHVLSRIRGAEPRILDGPDREPGSKGWRGDTIDYLHRYATAVMGPLG